MAFIVKIEGQTIELPENIAQDDQKIRESLAPFYPEIGQNSLITRAEKDGNIEITISKRAGTKGGASQPPSNTAIVEQLRTTLEELPEGGNSAVEMYRQLKKSGKDPLDLTLIEQVELNAKIAGAISMGRNEKNIVETAAKRLQEFKGDAGGLVVPEGF